MDFFVISKVLGSCVREVSVASEAPLFPHSPVVLRLTGVSQSAFVDQQVRFKPFSMSVMGPLQPEHPVQWSDASVQDLGSLAKEWFLEAERRLVEIHGVEDARAHVGRSDGPRTKRVPLSALLERDLRRRFGTQTTSWTAFGSLVRKARALRLGNPGVKGKALLGTWAKKLYSMMSVLDFQGDSVSYAKLEVLVSAAVSTGGAWDPESLEALDQEILRRQKEDSAKAMAKWRSWAKNSVSNGGKAAHAFSKKQVTCLAVRAGDGIAQLPVAGQAAIKQLLDQWEPL